MRGVCTQALAARDPSQSLAHSGIVVSKPVEMDMQDSPSWSGRDSMEIGQRRSNMMQMGVRPGSLRFQQPFGAAFVTGYCMHDLEPALAESLTIRGKHDSCSADCCPLTLAQ